MWSLVLGLALIFSFSCVHSKQCLYYSDCSGDEECCMVSNTCTPRDKCVICYYDAECSTGKKCLKQSGLYAGLCVDAVDMTTESLSFTVPDPNTETIQPQVTDDVSCTYDTDCSKGEDCDDGICSSSVPDDSSSDSDGLDIGYIFLIIILVFVKILLWAACLRMRYKRRVYQRMAIVTPTRQTATTVNTTTAAIINHPYVSLPPCAALQPGYAYSYPDVIGGAEASPLPPGAPPPYSSLGLEGKGNIESKEEVRQEIAVSNFVEGVVSPMQCAPTPEYNFHMVFGRQGNENNTAFEQPRASRDKEQ